MGFGEAMAQINKEKAWDSFLEESQDMTSKDMMKRAAELRLLDDQNVLSLITQKGQQESKTRTKESVLGKPGEIYSGRRENGNQFGGRTAGSLLSSETLNSLLSAPSRSEREYENNSGSLLGEKQQLSNKIDVEPQSESWNLLMELPVGNRRVVYDRMIDDKENYNTTDLRNAVTKELESIAKHKEVLRKEKQVEATEVSSFNRGEVSARAKFADTQTQRSERLFGNRVGKSNFFDRATGEITDRIDPMKPDGYMIGTKNIPGAVTTHVNRTAGGAGATSKEVIANTKAITDIDRQISALTRNQENINANPAAVVKQIKQLSARRERLKNRLSEASDKDKYDDNVFEPSAEDPDGLFGE